MPEATRVTGRVPRHTELRLAAQFLRALVVAGVSVFAGFLTELQVFASLDPDRLIRTTVLVGAAIVAVLLTAVAAVRLASSKWRKKVGAAEIRIVRAYNRVLDESSLNPVTRCR
jgi:NADH:ubiquinone oxidoreductase subunit 5 (subunit L)/multisubunit Na+/H+ antiporter MnhA subunit